MSDTKATTKTQRLVSVANNQAPKLSARQKIANGNMSPTRSPLKRPKTSMSDMKPPKEEKKASEKVRMTEESVELEHLRIENANLRVKVLVVSDLQEQVKALQAQLDAAFRTNEQ